MSTQTHKIALFRYPGADGCFAPFCVHNNNMDYGGTVRISEVVTIEFPMLPPEQSVAAEVSILDKTIAAVTEEFAKKLEALKSRKAELLALTHDEPESDDRYDCPLHGLQDGPDCVRC